MVIRLGPEGEETAFTHLLRKSLYILYNILNSQPVICNVIYTFRIFAAFWKIFFKFFPIWAVKFQDIFKCSQAVTNLKYSCKHLKVELKSIRSILRSHFYSGTVSNWIIWGGDYKLRKYIQTPEIHTVSSIFLLSDPPRMPTGIWMLLYAWTNVLRVKVREWIVSKERDWL